MDRTTIALPVLVTLVANAFVTYGLLFDVYHGYLQLNTKRDGQKRKPKWQQRGLAPGAR